MKDETLLGTIPFFSISRPTIYLSIIIFSKNKNTSDAIQGRLLTK